MTVAIIEHSYFKGLYHLLLIVEYSGYFITFVITLTKKGIDLLESKFVGSLVTRAFLFSLLSCLSLPLSWSSTA